MVAQSEQKRSSEKGRRGGAKKEGGEVGERGE